MPGLSGAWAIEFDNFIFDDEFPGNHVSVQVGGDAQDSASIGHAVLSDLGIDLLDGKRHTGTVQYTPPVFDEGGQEVSPGTLDVYIDSTLVVTTHLNLRSVDGEDFTDENGGMYVGFTAGTGLADSIHRITDWQVDDDTNGECVAPGWHVTGWGSGGIGAAAAWACSSRARGR